MMIVRTMLRHVLPVGLTTLCIIILWMLVTLPMIAVFVLDDAFVPSEYAKFLAYAFGVAFGLSTVVLFPLALLGEVLAKRNKHTLWVFPGFPFLCAGTILMARSVALGSFHDAILSWSGLALLISGLFAWYWVVLWTEKAVSVCWQKLRERKKEFADELSHQL